MSVDEAVLNFAQRGRAAEPPRLEDVVATAELATRPSRPPDHANECRAMAELAEAMAESPRRVMQKLAEAALMLTGADSAGISVLDATPVTDGAAVFRWVATAGAFAPFSGGTLPRDFSPCGVVLDRGATQLMADPARFYPYIENLRPHVTEVLLVPFYRGDTPIGTVWVVAHTDTKRFDAEDARLVTSLAKFASAALQTLANAEAVRTSEARLRQMADVMPQMVWVTLPDGYHEYYNRRWYEFTGVPEGSTDGEGWNEVFHADDRERAWATWRHSLATGEPYEIEYRLRHHSGEYRWTLGRALPVRNDAGEIERWFGTCTDIHAIKRMTAEREQLLESERAARAEAETANRAKDRFLAFLSHELRTPVSPVLLIAASMADDQNLPASVREDGRTILRNVAQQTRLIDDLLDVTRIEHGKLSLRAEVADLHDVLRDALATCQADADAQRVCMATDLQARGHHVNGDPARLRQVFCNLLKNAVKFTPAGGQITVRSSDREDGRVAVEVADTGKGVEPELLVKMFDPFEQGGRSITDEFSGLGLGLAISKGVVEAHGGSIIAASEGQGRGTTMTVELLAVTDVPVTSGSVRTPAPRSSGARPLNILLVDDHHDTLRAMARLLRGLEHRVTAVDSKAAALQAAATEAFDLVISDVGLPDGTGLDLMRELAAERSIRGIALTGYGTEGDIERTRAAGFSTHLTKPIDFPQLEAAIREATV